MVSTTSSKTVTFTIHATINGLINAVNDGAARGLITSSEQFLLIWYLQKALQTSARTRIRPVQLGGQLSERQGDQLGRGGLAAELGQRPLRENALVSPLLRRALRP